MRYGGFIEENFRAGLSWQKGGEYDKGEGSLRVSFVREEFCTRSAGNVRGRGGGAQRGKQDRKKCT